MAAPGYAPPVPSSPGPVDGRRERWAGHRARRRVALVRAGITAVERNGPVPSLDDVAVIAGVSRTVLYRYFHDLDDLLQSVAAQLTDDILARVLGPLDERTTSRNVIAGIVDGLAAWVEEHPLGFQFLRQRSVAATPGAQSVMETIETTVADRLAALLAAFMTLFGLPPDQAELGARALTGMVESSVDWWAGKPPEHRMSRADLVDELTTSVWAVISAHLDRGGVVLGLDEVLPVPDETPSAGTPTPAPPIPVPPTP